MEVVKIDRNLRNSSFIIFRSKSDYRSSSYTTFYDWIFLWKKEKNTLHHYGECSGSKYHFCNQLHDEPHSQSRNTLSTRTVCHSLSRCCHPSRYPFSTSPHYGSPASGFSIQMEKEDELCRSFRGKETCSQKIGACNADFMVYQSLDGINSIYNIVCCLNRRHTYAENFSMTFKGY